MAYTYGSCQASNKILSVIDRHHMHVAAYVPRNNLSAWMTATTTVTSFNRAKREAELVEKGASASEAALKADKELAEKEESQQKELIARLAAEK